MDDQNPYAAPQADLAPAAVSLDGGASILRVGNQLTLEEGVDLPQRCISCNAPATKVLKAWAFRRQGWTTALFLVLFASCIVMASVGRQFVPPAFEPWRLPITIGLVLLISRISRHINCVRFRFYICGKHQTLRYLVQSMLWIGVALIVFEEWIPTEWIGGMQGNMFLPFFGLMILASIIARRWGLQVRPRLSRSGRYVFQGFGTKYLDSFSDSDET